MSVDAQRDVGRSWDRYWSEGHRHACPTSFSGFYGAATQAFWRERCAGLTRADSLLELGCGNGGLLTFLQTCWPNGEGPELHGVDAARIDATYCTATAMEPDRIKIHGETRYDALPLPDGSVAMAVSQFGVEYGNAESTWSELLRVLAPECGVAFVMHKAGSRLDEVAADEVLLCRTALAPGGLMPSAEALLPYLSEARTAAGRAGLDRNKLARSARDAYNASTAALVDIAGMVRHGDAAEDLLAAVADVMSRAQSSPLAELRASLQSIRVKLNDNLDRLVALRGCALGPEGVAQVSQRLAAAGFAMEAPGTLVEEGYEMGWQLFGERKQGGQ